MPTSPTVAPPFSGIKPVFGGLFNVSPIQTGVFIRAHARDKRQVYLYLDSPALGRHPLAYNTGTMSSQIYPKNYGSYVDIDDSEFVTSSRNIGWIDIIKADSTTGVVAGMFEFQVANRTGQVVSITKGRFDVNFHTQ